jgi:hypothetical protein
MAAMGFAILVAVAACGPGLARRAKPEVSLAPDKLDDLVRVSITNGGLWFDDTVCAAQFGRPGNVEETALPAFRKCLAALDLRPSKRGDALADVHVYSYGAGFEVEGRVVDELDGLIRRRRVTPSTRGSRSASMREESSARSCRTKARR